MPVRLARDKSLITFLQPPQTGDCCSFGSMKSYPKQFWVVLVLAAIQLPFTLYGSIKVFQPVNETDARVLESEALPGRAPTYFNINGQSANSSKLPSDLVDVMPESLEIKHQKGNDTTILSSIREWSNSIEKHNYITLPSRTFIPWKMQWPSHPLPCIFDRLQKNPLSDYIQRQPSDEGFLFVKIDKASSSTLAGVAMRIAQAVYYKTFNTKTRLPKSGRKIDITRRFCRVRAAHLWSKRTPKYSTRDHIRSFLFTFLRKPEKRDLSVYYYFFIDRLQKSVEDDDTIIGHLKAMRNSQLKMVMDKKPRKKVDAISNITEMNALVQKTIDEFNFLGLVERMDESLVLLQLMLDLQASDVLYPASAKLSGGYHYTRWRNKNRTCQYIPKHSIPSKVQDFLDSDEWASLNYGDDLLYQAVNRSMDRTIDEVIGRDKFEKALAAFQIAKGLSSERCSDTVLPCTSNGTLIPEELQDKCYNRDSGCGYKCLDRLFPYQLSTDQNIDLI